MRRIFGFFLILSMLILLAGCASPLMNAAKDGDINAIKVELDKGADPNEQKFNTFPPLFEAIYYGHFDVVRLLLDRGADPNRMMGVWTPLEWAVARKKLKIVELLLEKGADIDLAMANSRGANRTYLESLKQKQITAAKPTPSPAITKEDITTIVQAAVEGAKTQKESKSPSIQSDIDRPNIADSEKVMGDNDLAIIIGIEGYQSLPKSDYSYDDARLMADYVKALGFKSRNIELLLEERATKSAIEKIIKTWLPNKAKPDSRVFVYYSGHGAPEPKTGDAYIVPFDGDPNYLSDTGYPLKSLYDSLGKLQVAEVTVVLDSCFSGAGGRSVLAKGARPLVMMTTSTVLPSNIAVLSATQGTQISTSSPEKGHGVFTYYFLKALKGGKKNIAEIYEYIKPLVEDEAKQINVQQSPSISPDAEKLKGRFLLRR